MSQERRSLKGQTPQTDRKTDGLRSAAAKPKLHLFIDSVKYLTNFWLFVLHNRSNYLAIWRCQFCNTLSDGHDEEVSLLEVKYFMRFFFFLVKMTALGHNHGQKVEWWFPEAGKRWELGVFV